MPLKFRMVGLTLYLLELQWSKPEHLVVTYTERHVHGFTIYVKHVLKSRAYWRYIVSPEHQAVTYTETEGFTENRRVPTNAVSTRALRQSIVFPEHLVITKERDRD